MSDPDAEAYGYALLLTRRTLTQALAGAPLELLNRPAPVAAGELTTLQACVRRSCSRERWWVWPRELPLPQLAEPRSLADLLYALVRHRAVTEELLMTATADDLAAVWHTLTRHAVTPKPISFASALCSLAEEELRIGATALDLRAALDPTWSEPAEIRDRAAAAVARLRNAPAGVE